MTFVHVLSRAFGKPLDEYQAYMPGGFHSRLQDELGRLKSGPSKSESIRHGSHHLISGFEVLLTLRTTF